MDTREIGRGVKSEIAILRQHGNANRQKHTNLAHDHLRFQRHFSGGNAAVPVLRGLRRSGFCFHLKGRHPSTLPICHRRSLSPQSWDADTSTPENGSHRVECHAARAKTVRVRVMGILRQRQIKGSISGYEINRHAHFGFESPATGSAVVRCLPDPT